MKLIEALKQVKDLTRKASDIKLLVSENCSLSTMDTPKYGKDQGKQIEGWIKAHSDILKEIARLKVAIQRTNLLTEVKIDFDNGKSATHSISEWILRRRLYANEEASMWSVLGDLGIKEGLVKSPSGDTIEIKIIRFYDPVKKTRIDRFISVNHL